MVPVEPEPAEYAGDPPEDCCKCGGPTRTWYLEKDVPLCGTCAGRMDPAQVPSKRAWLNKTRPADEAPLPKSWKPDLAFHGAA